MFYQLKNRLRYLDFRFHARKIYSSPPLPCDPGASCAVHTMLGAADMPLYLVAVKSLLSYYRTLAVVIHSDRTLSAEHEALLRRHVTGCTIITASVADERAAHMLGRDSFLFRCRSFDVNYRRLIDTELWSRSPKRIIMDSDIVTLQYPSELVEWIERGEGAFLMGKDPDRPALNGKSPTPGPHAHIQTVFRYRLKDVAQGLDLPERFLAGTTAGFYGCHNELGLKSIERLVKKCLELRMPLEHWGSDQCMVIYLLSISNPARFDPERYFNFWPEFAGKLPQAHIVHFLGTNRFHKGIYVKLASRIAHALHEGTATPAGCLSATR